MRLALFDIDGTLLREGIAPKLAFARALQETFDTTGPISAFRFAGMTDPQCVAEIMRMAGIADEVILERREACLDRYVAHLVVEMRNHHGARIFPGVKELLARLSGREDVLVGLLTGNVRRGAMLKLDRFKLGEYFRFGAFGDEHEDRGELARIALEKAERIVGRPVRVYALHPPELYQALKEENDAHPGDPIWLFQEVWTELPDGNDFWDPAFMGGFESEIRAAVDAIHGNALLPPRPGHAAGRYTADVSPYLAGWLLGREWEPYAVRVTQQRHPAMKSFRGKFFAVDSGTAMECWLGRELDLAASYEAERYGLARAVSFVNWPTLDVMRHPTEYERGGHQEEHDEDAFSVDPGRIRPLKSASPLAKTLGYFANYHVYPYYPDFMDLDPGYSAYRDKHGACNYAGYLTDLKAHTRGLPLLIGEFGVPTSRGIAHQQPQGIDHGGMSEDEQGKDDVRLLEDIQETGCAGGLLFALYDEWFKVNWLVARNEQPRDRDPLWHNLLDPEENYGLLGFDPPSAIHVDGEVEDWARIAPYASAPAGAMLRALYVTSDQNRFYLRIDLAPGPSPTVGVALDVLDPARADHKLPRPLNATWSAAPSSCSSSTRAPPRPSSSSTAR
jgi:phosphoglycolate phosphatase-like HAD superfamily hydrolase